MSDGLKPCPFCPDGGSPILSTWGNSGWGGEFDRTGRVSCQKCLAGGPIVAGRDDGEVALLATNAWNASTERTCKFVADIMNTAWDEDGNEIETGEVDDEAVMSCGNCGYPMVRGEYDGWWDEEKGPHGGWFLKPRFNCCPECGSKVVDWDGRKAVS